MNIHTLHGSLLIKHLNSDEPTEIHHSDRFPVTLDKITRDNPAQSPGQTNLTSLDKPMKRPILL